MIPELNSRARVVNSDGTASQYLIYLLKELARNANVSEEDISGLLQPIASQDMTNNVIDAFNPITVFKESTDFEPIQLQGQQEQDFALIEQPFKQRTRWDDLQVAFSTAKLPAANAPTWATFDFNIGSGVAYNVLGFGVNDYVDFYVQTNHAQKLNFYIEDHIHWTVPSDSLGDKFQFQLDVIAAGIGEDFAVPTGSPFTAEHTLDGTESGKHNYFDIADVPAFNTTVSSLAICRFKRIAATSDEYGSDVYVIYNDFHVLKDDIGSRFEDRK